MNDSTIKSNYAVVHVLVLEAFKLTMGFGL